MRVNRRPAFRLRFRCAFASWNCDEVMSPFTSIARNTSSRRATAATGFRYGSNDDGACGSPARSAACARFRSFAETEKYVSAAASIPYA